MNIFLIKENESNEDYFFTIILSLRNSNNKKIGIYTLQSGFV
jgi:hypothetical protein